MSGATNRNGKARQGSAVPTGNHYDKYESTHVIERRMMDGFYGALDAMLDGEHPTSVLEVGVGEGEILSRTAARFPEAKVFGLDLPDDRLAELWRERDIPARFGDVTALDIADRSVDLLLCIEVLEHVGDYRQALAEIERVSNGIVVLSVPREPIWRIGNLARGRYIRSFGNTPGHINHWSSRAFWSLIGERFEVLATRQPLPWTMVKARSRRS